MASLDQLIEKIPRSALVIGVLVLGLAFIVYQNPLQDGCGVEVKNFTREVRGVLIGFKTKSNKTQLPQIDAMKSLCREGNSAGACENYYQGLKKITTGLKIVNEQCLPKLVEEYPQLTRAVAQGLVTMALNAWGGKPPSGVQERLGWLTEADVFIFCRLRNAYPLLTSEEDYQKLRLVAYAEYPDAWPDSISLDKRSEVPRPRALKDPKDPNSKGSLSTEEIYKRSLFSLRCDLYQ